MVITPSFDVGVRQEEDGQDDGDDVPSRENQTDISREPDMRLASLRKRVDLFAHLSRIIQRREEDHGWDLEQTHL